MKENFNISLIAAMSQNHVIGVDNKLPWHSPKDLQHFKEITSGHTIIMGRKTYESIGKALPNRKNIVLTRDPNFTADNIEVFNNINTLLDSLDDKETFVIGGGTIYEQFLEYSNKVYLTVFETVIEGDTYFPELNDGWKIQSLNSYSEEDIDLMFMTYENEGLWDIKKLYELVTNIGDEMPTQPVLINQACKKHITDKYKIGSSIVRRADEYHLPEVFVIRGFGDDYVKTDIGNFRYNNFHYFITGNYITHEDLENFKTYVKAEYRNQKLDEII